MTLDAKTDFTTWSHENLARFAKEAFAHMQQQDARIESLELDLKVALNAYRNALKENHRA